MSESTHAASASPTHFDSQSTTTRTKTSSWLFAPFFVIVLPVAVAALLYWLEPFDPVHLPAHELARPTFTVPARNEHMRRGSEVLAEGHVAGPEDLVYDAAARVIYTGCEDGWIKRVTVNESVADSVVENWVNTGGRPLGLVFGQNGELIVGDAEKVSPSHKYIRVFSHV